MRQGFRVIDTDTHVNPSLDVLLRYADADLKAHLDELKPYTIKVQPRPGQGNAEDMDEVSMLSISPVRYQRIAGAKPGSSPMAAANAVFSVAAPTWWRRNRSRCAPLRTTPRGAWKTWTPRAAISISSFRAPGPTAPPPWGSIWCAGSTDAYHRYMAEYCSADARRLKSMILAPGSDPAWAAETIRKHADEPWVAAIWPLVPEGLPIDDPDLDPIWAAANEAHLPIMYHGFTIETPYFPGYRDIWDNPAMGRCAGQTWGGQRFLSFMLMSGILDRYPNLRVGTLECGHGWLPHWLLRLTRQIDYVRGSTPATLKHTPLEYARMGRVFCGIDFSEGVEMTKAVTDLLGDHVLMYQSDYPHPETVFPEHADTVIAWRQEIGETGMNKLMWENATRFFRLLSTPWE